MKTITGVHDAPPAHWVGDGFNVRSLFSYGDAHDLSPFILLDHAAPKEFAPTTAQRGVGWHPHRGFETVTIVYDGEVEHHDSLGNGGTIGPGDVQWMTAAGGILHEEFHSREFARTGGTMQMVQLWVNLPAKDKMSEPGYQTILDADIPVVALPNESGSVRVIAGAFGDATGAAKTHTPMDVLDVRLSAGGDTTIPVQNGRTLAVVVLNGSVRVNGLKDASAGQLVTFERGDAGLHLEAQNAANVLVLSGQPLDEPVYGYGPFVMNTRAEIGKAIEDFNAGRFGRIPA
jgi:redox-sensitive bicupin YhaK (pirin superfamily)